VLFLALLVGIQLASALFATPTAAQTVVDQSCVPPPDPPLYLNRDYFAIYQPDQNGVLQFVGCGMKIVERDVSGPWTINEAAIMEADTRINAGGSLTLGPDADIAVKGATLHVQQDGSFTAIGTETKYVTMHGFGDGGGPIPGLWGGIDFEPGSHGWMQWTDVDYAGGGFLPSCGCGPPDGVHTGILVESADVTISDSFVNYNLGTGVGVGYPGDPTLIDDTFESNEQGAVAYGFLPQSFDGRLSGLSAHGNGDNRLSSNGGLLSYGDTVTFPSGTIVGPWNMLTNPGLPLAISGDVDIQAGGSMNLAGGIIVELGGTISVEDHGAFLVNTNTAEPAPYVTLTTTHQDGPGTPTPDGSTLQMPQPGAWLGLVFKSGSSAYLNRVSVEYAGAAPCGYPGCGPTSSPAIAVYGAPGPYVSADTPGFTISDSSLSSLLGEGMSILSTSGPYDYTVAGVTRPLITRTELSNLAIIGDPGLFAIDATDNASEPILDSVVVNGKGIRLSPDGVSNTGVGLISALTMDPGQTVHIRNGAVGAADTWIDLGYPYVLENDLTIPAGQRLTMEPNVTVRFNGGLTVQQGGTFNAGQAGAAARVTLTTSNPYPGRGTWSGVNFQHGSDGLLANVDISDSGSGIWVDGSSPTIVGSRISNNSDNGITVVNSGNPTLTNDEFDNNTNHAVLYNFLPVTFDGRLAGLKANGNGSNGSGDVVRFPGGVISGDWTDVSTLASNPGIPLLIESDVQVQSGGALTFGAGTTALLQDTVFVRPGGTFTTTGGGSTPADHVTLTSSNPARWGWGGLSFQSGSSGALDFTDLSYAGTAITLEGASPTLTSLSISNGLSSGIDVHADWSPTRVPSSPTINGLIVSGVQPGSWAVQVDDLLSLPVLNNLTVDGNLLVAPDGASLLSNLTMNGSGQAVHVRGGPLAAHDTWKALGVPYILDGDLNIPASSSLMLLPGVTAEFPTNIFVQQGGTFNAGEAGAVARVTLTTSNPHPGPGTWGGVDFQSGSEGSLANVDISDAVTGVQVDGGAPTITNSTITNSSGNDVLALNGSLPVIHESTFGEVPSGNYGVLNWGWSPEHAMVDATSDCWNSGDGPSGAASGDGVPVSPGVNYTPWLACGATVSFSPAIVFQGTELTVSASNFGTSATSANVQLVQPTDSSVVLATLGTTFMSNGGFGDASFSVPATVAPGNYLVRVSDGAGLATSGSTLAVVAPPTVTGISPSSGPMSGGTQVTITGTGFATTLDNTIHFGSTQVALNVACEVTRCLATSPAGTDSVDVTVTVGGVTSATGAADVFTYIAPDPVTTLSSVTPLYALRGSPSATVTVTGTGFGTAAQVLWNGAPLANSYQSPTQLIASVPASDLAALTTAWISASHPAPGGGTSNLLAFFVSSAPVTASVSATNTISGGSAVAALPGLSGTGAGPGTLAVAQYAGNPEGTPPSGSSARYFDTAVAPGSSFSSITITDCDLNGGNTGFWWDGSAWLPPSQQTYDPATGCLSLLINGMSSPSLQGLGGTYFAVGATQTPVAQNASYQTLEGIALQVAAPGVLTNATGTQIQALVDSSPSHGTLNLASDGSFTFTPDSGFTGADSFTYRAGSGSLVSNIATVTITIQSAPAGGGGDSGPPEVGATPELDSLLLFASGLTGLGGFALTALRTRRRRPQ
jgi:parallel beta-helix repeat protein